MGTWGEGIFSDDWACDLRSEFKELLGQGLTPNQAREHMQKSHNPGPDKVVFWLALAATQASLGCLEDTVKEEALEIIQSGRELLRWRAGEASPSSLSRRRAALAKLRARLTGPQRLQVKVKAEEPAADQDELQRLPPLFAAGTVFSLERNDGKLALLRSFHLDHDVGSPNNLTGCPVYELLDFEAPELPPSVDLSGLHGRRAGPISTVGFEPWAYGEHEIPMARMRVLTTALAPEPARPFHQPTRRSLPWSALDAAIINRFLPGTPFDLPWTSELIEHAERLARFHCPQCKRMPDLSNQTTPFGTAVTGTGTSTAPSVSVTNSMEEVVLDVVGAAGPPTVTFGGSQTSYWDAVTAGAAGDIIVDGNGNTGNAMTAPGTALSWSHTTNVGGVDRLLLVGVTIRGGTTPVVSTLTYGVALTPLTFLSSIANAGGNARSELWYLVNPATGANNIAVTLSVAGKAAAGSVGLTRANGVFGTVATAIGASGTPSVAPASAVGDWVVDLLAVNRFSAAPGATASQTSRWSRFSTNDVTANNVAGISGTKEGAATSTTMSYGISTVGFAFMARSVQSSNNVRASASTALGTGSPLSMTRTLSASGPWAMSGVAVKPSLTSLRGSSASALGDPSITMSRTLGTSSPWAMSAVLVRAADAPTSTRLASLSARRSGAAVLVEWRTSILWDSLGFNVLREANGRRVKLNPSLLPAFSPNAASSSADPHAYSFEDSSPEAGAVYFLEEIDTSHVSHLEGPVIVSEVPSSLEATSPATIPPPSSPETAGCGCGATTSNSLAPVLLASLLLLFRRGGRARSRAGLS